MNWSVESLRGAQVLAVPAPALATLVVTGDDRQTWLNGLVTCDLGPLGPGGGAYGLAVSKVGRILSDLTVVIGEGRVSLGVPGSRVGDLRASFERYLVMEDAELASPEPAPAWVILHGARAAELARAVATKLGGDWAPVDRTGLGGAALVVDARVADGALEALAAAGAEVGDQAAWASLRLARAVPEFGVDFDEKTYPQEAALETTAVSFQKGCYLGQEVVCRLQMRGHVHRRLAAFVQRAPTAPAAGVEATTTTGEAVGAVTSAVRDPANGATLGLAMLRYAATAPGTTLVIGGLEAEVVAAPAR